MHAIQHNTTHNTQHTTECNEILGNGPNAELLYEQTLLLQPHNALAHAGLGLLLLGTGKYCTCALFMYHISENFIYVNSSFIIFSFFIFFSFFFFHSFCFYFWFTLLSFLNVLFFMFYL